MMDINSLNYHPEFPYKTWVVVEQPRNEPYRMSYNPVDRTFSRRSFKSIFYERGFANGDYGWIGGSGIPPASHHDVFIITKHPASCEDIILGHLCGVFLRQDNDHKFVTVDDEIRQSMEKLDISALDELIYHDLLRLFPRIGDGEGWFGIEVALNYILKKPHYSG